MNGWRYFLLRCRHAEMEDRLGNNENKRLQISNYKWNDALRTLGFHKKSERK